MLKYKKSQGAEQAALFVLVLLLLIVVYITAVPPEERERLLNTSRSTTPDGIEESNILLDENIGYLDVFGENKETLTLKDFLISVSESTEISKQTTGLAKRTWFSSKDFSTTFNIDDVDLIEELSFVLSLNKCEGSFSIYLNNREIAYYKCNMLNYIVDVDAKYLKTGDNLVVIRTDIPASILSKNIVDIGSFIVKIMKKNVENQLFKQIFEIEPTKLRQLKTTKLNFFLDCDQNKVGTFTITLNNDELYNQKPICGDMLSLNINPNKLSSKNTLEFFIQNDQIMAENVKLYLEYKDPYYRPYYFDINQELLDKIENNETSIHVYFKFTKDSEDIEKEADIIVNDYKFYLSTDETEFDKELNLEWLLLGTNYIKIIPRESMDVVIMRIYYE